MKFKLERIIFYSYIDRIAALKPNILFILFFSHFLFFNLLFQYIFLVRHRAVSLDFERRKKMNMKWNEKTRWRNKHGLRCRNQNKLVDRRWVLSFLKLNIHKLFDLLESGPNIHVRLNLRFAFWSQRAMAGTGFAIALSHPTPINCAILRDDGKLNWERLLQFC